MLPTISVAICTRNHPEELAACLRSLVPIRAKAREIIVVDNASEGRATRRAAEAFGATYVREPAIGLEHARNRAIRVAQGDIIAFTDDDCEVDAGWLDAIARGFSDPVVGALTGQAVSGSTANWVQRQFNSFARGFCRSVPAEATRGSVGDFYYRAVLGVGANMAYRRLVLIALDGFPDITRGVGDDDHMLFSVVRSGSTVRYAPESVVYQKHRDRLPATLARLFEYGKGTMRVLWFLSAKEGRRGKRMFLKNVCWIFVRSQALQLARSVLSLRIWHVLFGLTSLAGLIAGLFIPWGWRALIFGTLPASRGLHRLDTPRAEASGGQR